MKLRCVVLPMLALIFTNCSAARPEEPDVSNPFHCGVAFSVYYGMAKATENNNAVEVLERRMRSEAARAAALPASRQGALHRSESTHSLRSPGVPVRPNRQSPMSASRPTYERPPVPS